LLTIFIIYLFTVLWYTVFKRNIAIHNAQFELFWSYKKWFAGDTDLGQEIIANIVMFLPFGFLLSAVLPTTPSFKGGKKAAVVISAAIIFSLIIEVLQLVMMRGLFEWDDVFSNTLGAALGLLLYNLLSRFKYLPEAVGISFVLACLAVVITGRNVGGVEADNTSRAYCFQVDSSSCVNGEIELSGFALLYDHPVLKYDVILRDTDTGKRIKLETEQTQRPDVNNYFLCEHDYTDSGFEAIGKIDASEYEILIRWPWSVALSTGVYVGADGIHYSPNTSFIAPDVNNAPDLKDSVEEGTLRVYRPDYHCWVYQVENSLYWIVDQEFNFEEDGTTYIQYQLYTTQKDKLPQRRIDNGWFWDNISGCFEDYEVRGDFGPYRVMKRELPKEYSITSIVTGYYKDGEWIWKNYFRPIYDFSSYSLEEGADR
jgi:glycopeptide antibiotics resistance protein